MHGASNWVQTYGVEVGMHQNQGFATARCVLRPHKDVWYRSAPLTLVSDKHGLEIHSM